MQKLTVKAISQSRALDAGSQIGIGALPLPLSKNSRKGNTSYRNVNDS
jgi:hypothetical protein